jgi:hypothetical protein
MRGALDALRAFINGLRRANDPEVTRYYRIVPPPSGVGRPAPPPALVCATSVRVLDFCGRVVQASRSTAHIHIARSRPLPPAAARAAPPCGIAAF